MTFGNPSANKDAARLSLRKGDEIDARYVLDRELGRGGMGFVFKAWDELLERDVAIKFLEPGLIQNPTAVTRFQREALAAGRIGHDNICDVRDRGVTDAGLPYIVGLTRFAGAGRSAWTR